MQMRDNLNYTVLSFAAFKNDASCFKILFEYAAA
jgi:hypothetical protein